MKKHKYTIFRKIITFIHQSLVEYRKVFVDNETVEN
jgi:hypothetical protein